MFLWKSQLSRDERNIPTLTNAEKSSIIKLGVIFMDENISGAISGALDPDSEEASNHAKQYYESIRKMKTDIDNIANNTGYAKEYISKVKKHLFVQKHDLGEYGIKHFDPDYEIAQSWQRLIDGKNIQLHDYILLNHEYTEQTYMAQGYFQQQAHDMSNQIYNYTKALRER